MPKKEDTWWDIVDGTSADGLSAQINEILISYALPFLKQFETEQQLGTYHRGLADSPEWKRNYPVAIDALADDLRDKKDDSEIEKRISKVRHVGKINGVDKTVVEATIERVLKTYGPDKVSLRQKSASRSLLSSPSRSFEGIFFKCVHGFLGLIQKVARLFAPKRGFPARGINREKH